MATLELPADFKDFLRLLNSHRIRYLLVGGYAVGYHGYPRPTADMDVWIAIDPENAKRMVDVFHEFGYRADDMTEDLFLAEEQITRMGVPPMRLEVFTTLSGVEFEGCFRRRVSGFIDGVPVKLVSLDDLLQNKQASGRLKDLTDIEQLKKTRTKGRKRKADGARKPRRKKK
jgi:predicted nucleotidyltransferase